MLKSFSMRKLLVAIFFVAVCSNLFAQEFNADRFAFEAVIAASKDKGDGNYEIQLLDLDSKSDKTWFVYTWNASKESGKKIFKSVTYYQFKCAFLATCEEADGNKNLVLKIGDSIASRQVNADGSQIEGGTDIQKIAYNWSNSPTSRMKNLKEIVDAVAKNITDALARQDDGRLDALVEFLCDNGNLAHIDTDTLGILATRHKELCSVPAVIARLKTEKSEMWFKDYLEKISDAPFRNTFKLFTVKESDVAEYKYRAEFYCPVYKVYSYTKEDKELAENLAYINGDREEKPTMQRRKEALRQANMGSSNPVLVKFYTNDAKFIDLNKNDSVEVSGKFKKFNALGLVQDILSIDVYE